jgi:hypothetical protein
VFVSGGDEPNTITVSGADVYASYGDENPTTSIAEGTVKIGDMSIGTVSNGQLSFTLPETISGDELSTVSTESLEWADWDNVEITEESAQVGIWNNLDLYSGDTKTGKLSFGTLIDNNFREVQYMYFDKACTISGTYNGGVRLFNARQGWNLFHDFGGSIHSTNFDHFIDVFKWVFTAEPTPVPTGT